jgi:DNA polymerase-1
MMNSTPESSSCLVLMDASERNTVSGTAYFVDAHSLIFQVFHAIRGMTSPSGMPTNALFGFLRDILYLRSLKPDYLVVAFDLPGPTFRSAIYPEYKAHREPPPDDLQMQIPMIVTALQAMRVPVLSKEGYEADDLLATLATAGEKRGLQVYVCTSDKDCRQLLSERVRLYNLRKRESFGPEQLLEDWGIRPDQVVDLQSLVGDSVDNVPGVPGIGVKTAAKLLQEFGTLENLLANTAQVPGKKREALEASGAIVERSRALVRLETAVEIPLTWDEWHLQPMDTPRLMELCKEWGFNSLANQIRALDGDIPGELPPAVPVQAELFGNGGQELFPFGANAPAEAAPEPTSALLEWQPTYQLVNTSALLDVLVEELATQSRFVFDTETTGLDALRSDLVGIALCWQPNHAYYLPVRGPSGEPTLPLEEVRAKLGPLFANPALGKANQNIKYDLLVLRQAGFTLANIDGDPMLAHYLLHAGERSHSLDDMARTLLNHTMIPITDLIGKKKPKQPQLTMDQVPTARVAEYAGEDADASWRLLTLLEAQLDAPENAPLRAIYREVELPLLQILADMEHIGIRLDSTYLHHLSQEMAAQLEAIESEIYELAGKRFNIASLPQLRTVLFDELKLPVQGRTGTTNEPSTDQESLEKLAALKLPAATIARKVLEHRQISKLKGTYVDALPTMVHPRTGRIHTSFNQTVTATGRLSSSDPNLQNIPVRRENGQAVRKAFLPAPGWVLLCADYSQIELRLLAHFCQDETLCRAFAEGRDIHATVAAEIFGVSLEAVSHEQRRMAKTVNFGVIYGISASGLGQRLGIPKTEAAAFIQSYFGRYPKVEAYQTKLLSSCRSNGYTSTILGRRRHFDPKAIRARSDYQNRNAAEREAINMEVQGSAADLIKLAMLEVARALREGGFQARMLLQVHDELVFECPPNEVERLAEMVRRTMIDPVRQRLRLQVPLAVDLSVGPNWLEVEER